MADPLSDRCKVCCGGQDRQRGWLHSVGGLCSRVHRQAGDLTPAMGSAAEGAGAEPSPYRKDAWAHAVVQPLGSRASQDRLQYQVSLPVQAGCGGGAGIAIRGHPEVVSCDQQQEVAGGAEKPCLCSPDLSSSIGGHSGRWADAVRHLDSPLVYHKGRWQGNVPTAPRHANWSLLHHHRDWRMLQQPPSPAIAQCSCRITVSSVLGLLPILVSRVLVALCMAGFSPPLQDRDTARTALP